MPDLSPLPRACFLDIYGEPLSEWFSLKYPWLARADGMFSLPVDRIETLRQSSDTEEVWATHILLEWLGGTNKICVEGEGYRITEEAVATTVKIQFDFGKATVIDGRKVT